jgi:16S rRNA G1207 methylase RsmC
MEVELPEWREFAQAIAPMMALPAEALAEALMPSAKSAPCDVLELAAGHGLFGIALGARNRQARITALDWPSVVPTARKNATRAGLGKRFATIGGSVFHANFGGPYDLVLIANFVHMLSAEQNVRMFRRALAAMKPKARLALFDFVVNEDRISPPLSAMFAMAMLTATEGGDTYPFSELESMCMRAGFGRCELREVGGIEQRVVLAYAE